MMQDQILRKEKRFQIMITERNGKQSVLIPMLVLFVLSLVMVLPITAWALTDEEKEAVSGTGWQTLPGGKITYIVDSKTPAAGFKKLKKNWYHFDKEGYLSLGWFEENGERYFATRGGKVGALKGSLKSGYVKVDDEYYLFSNKNKAGKFGRQERGWVKVKKMVFYYDEDGKKLKGLQEIKGKLYFFAKKGGPKKVGMIKTGWKTISGKKYYFRSTGKVGKRYGSAYQNKKVKINGITYEFGKDGSLTKQKVALTKAQKKFIDKIGKLANADMKKTGVLASVTVAQAIIESAWGTSTLAKKAKNLFGMKANIGGSWKSEWDGKKYKVKTQEYLNGRYVTITDSFRKYKTIQQSVSDHSAYLLGSEIRKGVLRYAGIKGCKSYEKTAKIIKKGGYATAPNYVDALVNVIEKYNLDQFDQ